MTSIALNRKVLILNQSYEPLSVVSAQKAIVLIYLGKAEIVEKHPTMVVRSIMISFPYPSIIRLSRYVYIPRKRVILSRKNVLRRDGFRCQYCGEKSQPLTVDHVIPKRMGGRIHGKILCVLVLTAIIKRAIAHQRLQICCCSRNRRSQVICFLSSKK